MPITLTAEDARQSLVDHVRACGEHIRATYGPNIGWRELHRILGDRTCVRYPCEIVFDSAALLPGECAHPVAVGDRPEQGFRMHVHPLLLTRLNDAVWAVLYQLAGVNYGAFCSPSDAEEFGAAVLGIHRDAYYAGLCAIYDGMADS